ncbi:hypothetical protein ACFW04_007637 [Cataglyphis niger]
MTNSNSSSLSRAWLRANCCRCADTRQDTANNNFKDAETPLREETETLLHRIAFTVWHTALHIESEHNGGYESQSKNVNNIGRSKQHVQTSAVASTPARTPGVGADSTMTGSGKGGGRVTEVMELCYVTERIIALWYREDAQGVLEHATTLLRGKHADNYMIFNLSSPGRPGEPNTREAGWPQGLAPSLERLCALCKELDSWLNGASNRVVVLHARGNKERLGVAVSAYMNYSSICGGRDQALDRFAMRRFLDDKIGSLQVPSHRRYIEYFSGLLSGSLRISQSPLYLTHLTVLGVPLFEPTGCRAFLKVYEGLTPVYTSDLYSVTNAREFTVNLGGLRLRGDILVKCYHRVYSKQTREVMFSLQSMPDPPTDDYNRDRGEKMYIQETRSYSSHGSSHPTSTYSTLKDSYRSYGKESSPPYNSSSSYSTLKNSIEHRKDDFEYRVSPDRKITESSNDSYRKHTDSFSPPGNIDFIDEDIPYHARQTSQPFSYGATTDMIKHQKLSSPSLVRKASVRGVAPVVDFEDILGENSRRPISPLSPNTPDPPPEFANGPVKSGTDHIDGLSWLRQQQLKLAARRDERNPGRLWRQETGNRVIGELRSLQRGILRHDGYASDSAVLDDDDDMWAASSISGQPTSKAVPYTSAPASPLLPQRSSSRKYNGNVGNGVLGRPRAESMNERPFVSVKRAYEYRKFSDSQSPPTSPRSALAAALPLGLANQQQSSSNNAERSQQHQQQPPPPPRPESRSDSFARTDALLREHRHHQLQSGINNSNDHIERKQTIATQEYATSSRSARPESRNRVAYQSVGSYSSASSGDQVDGGLLTMVDQPDPLVSLIQSLAEISPIRTNPSTPKTENEHPAGSHIISASTTMPTNVPSNVTNCSPNQSPKAWQNCIQPHNDSTSSWTERSVSPGSAVISGASRPQTPAFPVHPRTPYVNNASPTVTFASDRTYMTSNNSYNVSNNNNNVSNEAGGNNNNNVGSYGAERTIYIEERKEASKETGLPPKSPTTQRRLSFPASGPLKQMHNKRWPLTNQSASFDYSKDRPVSPLSESAMSQPQAVSRSPGTPTHIEFAQSPKSATSYTSINSGSQSSPQVQYYGSRRSSIHSNTEPQEVADANVKFVRDTSRIWYKPNISREQAISMLKDATPGTFVVRDSNSFPGAFGLALKVATPPPGAPSSPRDPSSELVRHFLIEPTSRGVRLKGCANEPVFSSLSALVYQHSLMAMALPCQLLLPEPEAAARALDSPGTNSTQQLLAQGAACNVLYLYTIDTESLTGPQAIKKAITNLFEQKPLPIATIVHFKVSTQGITLTDNARKIFFRRHYPTNNISYCGLDTEERTWEFDSEDTGRQLSAHRCFGFVARKPAHKSDNQCHVFAELEPEQPATAIVNFVNKVMMGSSIAKANIV